MAWNDETYLIGEKVKVELEKDFGIVTRIDFQSGLIYVLFKKMREVAYPYPEAIDENIIIPQVNKKA